MKKVLVSILALAMMLSCFCTINVFADEITPTITAKNAAGEVVGTYSTIDTAANAAGVGGTVVLSEGTFEFNGRQTIAVAGITLEGAGKDLTSIVPSANYKNASDTNRKALLTITANNVTVKDLTIDGSVYGSTITSNADFIVLRCNSGSNVELNNILVKGSPKALIQIGTSSTVSSVTGVDLFCEAEYKALPSILTPNIYADVEIVTDSSFTLTSGVVNGFINADDESSFTNNTSNHYHLDRTTLFVKVVDVTTTTKHFVESYYRVRGSATTIQLSTFRSTVLDNKNIIRLMTNETVLTHDADLINHFIVLLDDIPQTSTDTVLSQCRADLVAALPTNN